jgi:SAM-dependent methyltransferase
MKLNIGPGQSGDGDWKIDLYPFDDKTKVLDIVVEPLPFDNDFFDEVEARHVLEHVPTQLRWIDRLDGEWKLRFPRVDVMREIHRVLKPGGILLAVVPGRIPEWFQDPTHVDVPWTLESFDYFCGAWGGNQAGGEQREAYGINFQFERIFGEYDDQWNQWVVRLKKP